MTVRVITPNEAASERYDGNRLDKILIMFNNAVKMESGGCPYIIPINIVPQYLHEQFVDIMKNAGWKVELVCDQRDGDFYNITS